MVLVGVGLTLAVLFVLRPLYREHLLGHYLTRLTTMVEQREQNLLIGVSPQSMTFRQRFLLDREWEKGVAVFRRYPPTRITRELLKNSLLARASGRFFREQAIYRLLDSLSEEGIALDLISFHQATSHKSVRT